MVGGKRLKKRTPLVGDMVAWTPEAPFPEDPPDIGIVVAVVNDTFTVLWNTVSKSSSRIIEHSISSVMLHNTHPMYIID